MRLNVWNTSPRSFLCPLVQRHMRRFRMPLCKRLRNFGVRQAADRALRRLDGTGIGAEILDLAPRSDPRVGWNRCVYFHGR